jgi:hypothetical protein
MPVFRRSRHRRPAASSAAPERVVLRFAGLPDEDDRPHEDLSAVAVTGDAVWLAGDEGTSLERLVRDADGSFGARTRFPLSDLLDLPGDADEEVDVEGIDLADGWLWVVGSHASARRKADPSDTDVRPSSSGWPRCAPAATGTCSPASRWCAAPTGTRRSRAPCPARTAVRRAAPRACAGGAGGAR